MTAEFLPSGVLTTLAVDLNVAEGIVGLSVSATALTALLAALGLSSMFPRTDGRCAVRGADPPAAVADGTGIALGHHARRPATRRRRSGCFQCVGAQYAGGGHAGGFRARGRGDRRDAGPVGRYFTRP